MKKNNYWVPLYYREALIGQSCLQCEEIGLLFTITILIYNHERPIDFDAEYIGRYCRLRKDKCERLIHSLINKGLIHINEEGKITQETCMETLNDVREMREERSKNGRKGAETRRKNKLNQELKNSQAIPDVITNTNTKDKNIKNTNTTGNARQGGGFGLVSEHIPSIEPIDRSTFDIEQYIDDHAKESLRRIAGNSIALEMYMDEYNNWQRGSLEPLPENAVGAFCAWLKKRVKRGQYDKSNTA